MPVEQKNMSHPMPEPAAILPYDDEISLIDLWLVLAKRKKLIMIILLIFLLAGLTFALLKPKQYRYSTTIEIGTILVNTGNRMKTQLIDAPSTAMEKIKNSYIPSVLQAFASKHPDEANKYELKVDVPQKSELLEISGKGDKLDGKTYVQLIQHVVDELVSSYRRIMTASRSTIETKLVQAKVALADLQDPVNLELKKGAVEQNIKQVKNALASIKAQLSLLRSKYKRLGDSDIIIRNEMKTLEANLKRNFSIQDKALSKAKDAATALTTLMVSNEIQQNHQRFAALAERLQVTQPNLRQGLLDQSANLKRKRKLKEQTIQLLGQKIQKIVNDNQRKVVLQSQRISMLHTQLNGIRETHTLIPPFRSLKPVGLRRSVIVILSVFLGIMFGVFAAFFAEFLGKVKEQTQVQSS